ncbi:MAG: response regulator [Acidobacteriia bacterium]|nr:response regulator [Terriglobia bacterium]
MSPKTDIFVPYTWTVPASTPAEILIVDNDEDVLVNLERVLEDQGYPTATAINYEQAFTQLSQRTFDLLILDDYLSDRDSIQVMVDLRCSEVVPRFVVVTYHRCPSRGEQARLQVLGVRALINKLAHDDLTQAVRAMLDLQEQSVIRA